MPNISIYLCDDDAEYLAETIGKGNVSPYIQNLINNDKGRVTFLENKRFFDGVLNLALFFIGLAFIFLVIGTKFFPEFASYGYVVVLLIGGVLLTMQGASNINNKRRMKNGIINPRISV